MQRKNIYDILKEAKIDLKKEYARIYHMFYRNEIFIGEEYGSPHQIINDNFSYLLYPKYNYLLYLTIFKDNPYV